MIGGPDGTDDTTGAAASDDEAISDDDSDGAESGGGAESGADEDIEDVDALGIAISDMPDIAMSIALELTDDASDDCANADTVDTSKTRAASPSG